MDRDVAIGQVVKWGERSTRYPVVIFGPEGCGKSAFLRQAAEVLREFGYDVIYVDIAHMNFIATPTLTRWLRSSSKSYLRCPVLPKSSLQA